MVKPSKKKREDDIVATIKKYKVMFIEHIFAYYTGLKKSQFYKLRLHESDAIKEAIHENRVKATGFLINKWIATENPTLQIAAYRMLCTKEERELLDNRRVEISAEIKSKYDGMTDDELLKEVQEYERRLS